MIKKTKNGKKIPITNYNRAQALLRIPEYVEDLRNVKKGETGFKLIALTNK